MTIQAGQLITIGTAKFIVDDVRDGNRVGDIILRYTLRDGFIKLNGAEVLRADYPRLVKWIDDNNLWTEDETEIGLFGVGDGSTTMRLPDLRNRFLEGVDSGGGDVVEAGLPNITGSSEAAVDPEAESCTGALSNTVLGDYLQPYANYSGMRHGTLGFNAARSNLIYGNSDTVQPKSIQLIAQIKY